MKEIDVVLKAMADPNRIRILKLLERHKLCVCELAYVLGVTQPSVSRHLKKLKKAGLIVAEKEGFWTNYLIVAKGPYAGVLLDMLKQWLNKDSTVKKDLQKVAKVDRRKLCQV